MKRDFIREVYELLRDRDIHPSGAFDNAGRWYAKNSNLISVRTPSRRFPYSELTACRTLKYVKAVVAEFKCKSYKTLLRSV